MSKQTKEKKKEEKQKNTPMKQNKEVKQNKQNKPEQPKKKIYKSKVKKQTQITDTLTYNVENMMFDEIIEFDVPNQKAMIKAYRIPIYTLNQKKDKDEKDTFGDLIFDFSELMCFGISVNTDPKTGEPSGHSMSLSLMS